MDIFGPELAAYLLLVFYRENAVQTRQLLFYQGSFPASSFWLFRSGQVLAADSVAAPNALGGITIFGRLTHSALRRA